MTLIALFGTSRRLGLAFSSSVSALLFGAAVHTSVSVSKPLTESFSMYTYKSCEIRDTFSLLSFLHLFGNNFGCKVLKTIY